jgi:hypothetical protein
VARTTGSERGGLDIERRRSSASLANDAIIAECRCFARRVKRHHAKKSGLAFVTPDRKQKPP